MGHPLRRGCTHDRFCRGREGPTLLGGGSRHGFCRGRGRVTPLGADLCMFDFAELGEGPKP